MARKIIREADRQRAREEAAKAAEVVPVKPASTSVNKVETHLSKPGKIKSISDLDAASFSALQDSGTGAWTPKPSHEPVTLNMLLDCCGKNGSLPGGENYRIDCGILFKGHMFFTDGKLVVRVESDDPIMHGNSLGKFVLDDAGHVELNFSSVYFDGVGYHFGRAGCDGGDFDSFPVDKLPFNWTINPLESAKLECVIDVDSDSKECSTCSGTGQVMKDGNHMNVWKQCDSCHGTGEITVTHRFVFKTPDGKKIAFSPKHYNLMKSLPDFTVCRGSTDKVLRFSFHTIDGKRGYGMCVSPDAEESVKAKSVLKPIVSDPDKEVQYKMLSGSGGSVGKTNTSAAEFAKGLNEHAIKPQLPL